MKVEPHHPPVYAGRVTVPRQAAPGRNRRSPLRQGACGPAWG